MMGATKRLRDNPRYMLFILALAGLFNATDRGIFGLAMPAIKAEFSFTDTELGMISGVAFGVFYALAALPIGWLGGIKPRRTLIAICLALWSLFTALTAAAQGFISLFAARLVVGIGEAGGIPLSLALIAARFPPERRAGATAVLQIGVYAGTILGAWGTGLLIAHLGWRGAFVVLGLPGLLLALVLRLTIAEPQEPGRETPGRLADAWALRRRPALLHITLAFIASGFNAYGTQAWVASFYHRSFGMTAGETGFFLGVVLGIGGLAGNLAGGFVNDRYAARNAEFGLRAMLWTGIVALPMSVLAFATHDRTLSLTLLTASQVAYGLRVTILYTAVQNLTEPRLRPMAIAIVASLTVLIGSGLGPPFVGKVSDLAQPAFGADSLGVGLMACNALTIWILFHAWRALRLYRADYAVVNDRLG